MTTSYVSCVDSLTVVWSSCDGALFSLLSFVLFGSFLRLFGIFVSFLWFPASSDASSYSGGGTGCLGA